MALARLEVRFSPRNQEEAEMIEALNSLGDEYGAKGRYLKARLLRGYAAAMRQVESIKQEADPLAKLDRLAESVEEGHYRVLRALLYERSEVSAPPAPVPTAPPAVLLPAQEEGAQARNAGQEAANRLAEGVGHPAGAEAPTAASVDRQEAGPRFERPPAAPAVPPPLAQTVPAAPEQPDSAPQAADRAPVESRAAAEGEPAPSPAAPEPEAPAPPKFDWSRMKGIAGRRSS